MREDGASSYSRNPGNRYSTSIGIQTTDLDTKDFVTIVGKPEKSKAFSLLKDKIYAKGLSWVSTKAELGLVFNVEDRKLTRVELNTIIQTVEAYLITVQTVPNKVLINQVIELLGIVVPEEELSGWFADWNAQFEPQSNMRVNKSDIFTKGKVGPGIPYLMNHLQQQKTLLGV